MKDIFCARCQKVTPHKGSVDGNGEFLFECQNQIGEDKKGKPVLCDRFIKVPANHPVEEFDNLFASHQASNEGQVSVEEQEKKLAEVLAAKPVKK